MTTRDLKALAFLIVHCSLMLLTGVGAYVTHEWVLWIPCAVCGFTAISNAGTIGKVQS